MAKFVPKPAPAASPAVTPTADRGDRPDPDAVRSGMEQVRSNFDLFLLAQKLVAQAGGVAEAVSLVELVPLLNEVAATINAADR